MPIAQRTVEPTLICQSRGLASNQPASLPSTSLVALTSIIRQLSALSKYADEMFGDVFNEASKYAYRSGKMEERVVALAKALAEKKADDSVVLRDVPVPAADKPEQHILNVHIPRALKEKYHLCDRPPPLTLFARLRSDGRDGMSLYTDPTLFFRQWLYNMNKEANVLRNPKKKRLRRSRSCNKPGAALYIAPPSASPPPPLSYPVYENRELEVAQQEEEDPDNIYEMLPDQDYSPPADYYGGSGGSYPPQQSSGGSYPSQQSSGGSYPPQQSSGGSYPPQQQPFIPQEPHQSSQYNQFSYDEAQDPDPPELYDPTPRDQSSILEDHSNSFQRNRSYDLSMQYERECEEGPDSYYNTPSQLSQCTTPQQYTTALEEEVVLPIQNSLTSLSLDNNRSVIAQLREKIYDNHKLSSPTPLSNSRIRLSSDPNDRDGTMFSLDDLPPPPEDLLDTTPASSTPYRAAAAVSPQELYDPLPPRVIARAEQHSPARALARAEQHSPARALARGAEQHSPARALARGAEQHSPARALARAEQHSPARALARAEQHSPARALARGAEQHSPARALARGTEQHSPACAPITRRPVLSSSNSLLERKAASARDGPSAPEPDLLAAIRAGINLRPMKKAQEHRPSQPQPGFHDVASILQRRKFLIGDNFAVSGESDSESEGEWDDEDDSWN